MGGEWNRCVVALGANLGDRAHTAFEALADLRATEGFRVVGESSLRETVALTSSGPDSDAPGYLNQVILLDSAWSPEHTLQALLDIERAHGRQRTGQQYANRTLDLDLITYGDLTWNTPSLSVPHPRAHERRFVLEPWAEIEPEAVLRGHGPIASLLAALPDGSP